MQKQLIPSGKGHPIQGAFYVIVLLAVCVMPSALAQPTTTNRSAVKQEQGGQSANAFAVAAPATSRPRPTPRAKPTSRPEPLPRPQQKPQPAGIVRLFSVNVGRPENSESWINPNIDGMRIRPIWRDVQPGSATFDWSSIDELLGLATQHSKFIGLSVSAGTCTPRWVYDAGATEYHLQDGSGLSMPIPWDAVFQTKWLAFVRTMGQRYDGNPALRYVVISGLGQFIETVMAKTNADNEALSALGGPPAWEVAAQQIIAAYAEAFPTTPFFITASRPFLGAETILSLETVIDWAVATYPGRFGIMNATLNAHSSTNYYPNLAIYTYYHTQPTGFQMLCSAIHNPQRLGGTLDQTLTAGVLLGAKYVELYQDDADAAQHQTILQIQGDALEGNL
jgi:hypothetical protein